MAVRRRLESWLSCLPWYPRQARDADLARELRDHLELEAEEQRAAGLSRKEASYAAHRALGNTLKIEEDVRVAWGFQWFETLAQDIRYALRTLRKSPCFTAVAVLTLALGIGVNAAVFSLVHSVILEPLPYSQPNQLVGILEQVHLRTYQNDQYDPSPGDFAEWRSQNSVFEGIAVIQDRSFNLTGDGQPERVEGEAVSANLFSLLGVPTVLGRTFGSDEDVPGGPHVVVMGYGLWVSRYGADRHILNKSILLDGVSYRVIGIMDRSFRFPDPANFHSSELDQLWIPIALGPADLSNHGSHSLDGVLARLQPGVSLRQAQAQMEAIAKRVVDEHPDTNDGVAVKLVSLRDDLVGNVETELWFLLGTVGLVMLMVCANIVNLLLVRASTRSREFALRTTLGAPRTRILRQLLTESTILALFGGCAGVVLASGGLHALQGMTALRTVGLGGLPHFGEIRIDIAVLYYSLGISLLTGLVFGIAPIGHILRTTVQESLKAGARESESSSRIRLRDGLVVAETALCVIVIIGAALLLRSFLLLQETPLGFDPDGLLTFRVIPRIDEYSHPLRLVEFYEQALANIDALPGVKSAGAISFLPLTFYQASKGFSIEGRPALSSKELPTAVYGLVSPDYFKTMRVPVLEGRDFSWNDTTGTLPVIVINQAMALAYWPNQNVIGKRIKSGRPDESLPWLTIIGVVGSYRDFDVASQPRPTVFFPISQVATGTELLRDWVVRTETNPLAVVSGVREAMWRVNKNIPISRVQTMQQVRSSSLAEQQFTLTLLALFSCLALFLATVGLYGVTAYATEQRTREIGIRMALGAQPRDVMRMILFRGASIGFAGVAIGIAAALSLTRLMGSLLYGIRTSDPLAFGAVGTLLGAVSLAACCIPARRAMKVDPMVALKYE